MNFTNPMETAYCPMETAYWFLVSAIAIAEIKGIKNQRIEELKEALKLCKPSYYEIFQRDLQSAPRPIPIPSEKGRKVFYTPEGRRIIFTIKDSSLNFTMDPNLPKTYPMEIEISSDGVSVIPVRIRRSGQHYVWLYEYVNSLEEILRFRFEQIRKKEPKSLKNFIHKIRKTKTILMKGLSPL